MVEKKEITIIVDHREFRNNSTKELFELGANIKTESLEVGDFILSDDVVVELKKVDDFVVSLVDGRLFTQARELINNFKKPLYIIEGFIDKIYEVRNVYPNAIRAAMISLLLDYKIPIVFTHNEKETAEMLYTIAKREQVKTNKEISLRGSRRAWSLAEQQQFFIEGLPLVGPKLAKNLLKEFKTPLAIINAELDDLKKVDKMGPKKIENIKKLLISNYNNERNSK